MRHDQRVVIDVDDAAFRLHCLGHFVSVVESGQSGADIEELPDPYLAYQISDHPDQERALSASTVGDIGDTRPDCVARLAVDRVVVLATQPVVPDSCRLRLTG